MSKSLVMVPDIPVAYRCMRSPMPGFGEPVGKIYARFGDCKKACDKRNVGLKKPIYKVACAYGWVNMEGDE